jgi:iron complex outermembrane recepter protein
MKKIFLLCSSFLFILNFAIAQNIDITGKVIEESTGLPITGANVVVQGTSNGTTTDLDGIYKLTVKDGDVITISFIGYVVKDIAIGIGQTVYDAQLEEDITSLQDLVIVGSRFNARSVNTSPVPIDNISSTDLISTSQLTVDQMLNFKVPAYNATQQTISDATAHFNPADLRGLGPSRTLVLINGKRKNASSLVFINDTPGKGEVGVDMQSIPAASIQRVEVLRDGASAQYGSDAIAGVINIILKEDIEYTSINVFSGVTTQGDGFNFGYDINLGTKLAKKGFLNITAGYSDQRETNRAPETGKDLLFGNIFGDQSLLDGTNPWLQANPNMGMRVGTPNMIKAEAFANVKFDIGENTEVYAFGGLTQRDGLSYALYRAPYWITDDFGLLTPPGEAYVGFQPTFETDIVDHTIAAGIKGEKNGWNYDVSLTNGSNSVDYTIGNSINVALGAQSPTLFQAGGYKYSNTITNIDFGKSFENMLTLGFGTEFRKENFQAIAGEEASYIDGGVQSFPGLQPQNEVDAVRYNIGAYLDIALDLTEDFLIGAAVRAENYSDFGNNLNYKINARYKFAEDKFVVRGSYSTGFRAPSLHQIYLSNVQTLVSGGTVSNQGTFNNNSSVLRQLEVETLKQETAQNMSVGFTTRPFDGFSLSADYYNVKVNDRIVYSSSIASSDTLTTVGKILADNNITSLKFFTNAVDTKTTGFDIVADYLMDIGTGSLNITAAYNNNQTEIVGEIATPQPIADAGVELFDRKEQSRILTSRPNQKLIFGVGYNVNKLTLFLNNTLFGEVTWQHATDPANDQTFSSKLITDLNLEYQFTSVVRITVGVNNLLNVYPDVIDTNGDFVTDLGGRFQYPWEVNQFGFNGTTLSGKVSFVF